MSKSGVKVVLNRAGVRSMLKSGEMQGVLKSHANAIAQRCGEGYGVDAYTGKTRVNVSVGAKTWKAAKDNSEHNTLLKSIKG